MNTWTVRAHCPKCRRRLLWQKLVSEERREKYRSLETLGLECPNCFEVDALVTWELERPRVAEGVA